MKLISYIDGAFDKDRKAGAWGLVIFLDDLKIKKSGKLAYCSSAFDAELTALKMALKEIQFLAKDFTITKVLIRGDNPAIVQGLDLPKDYEFKAITKNPAHFLAWSRLVKRKNKVARS